MKLLNVKIKDYKSIKDSGEINLHNVFNALAGKNNTGKSAFIEAIYKVVSEGHIESSAVFNVRKSTEIVIEVSLLLEELNSINADVDPRYTVNDSEKFRVSFRYFSKENVTIIDKFEAYYGDSFNTVYENINHLRNFVTSHSFRDLKGGSVSFGGMPTFLHNLMVFLRSKIVYIAGSRHVPSTEPSNLNQSLNINGTNLNGFLYTLHNNEEKIFDIIVKTFTLIFNDVTSINTPIEGANQTYVSILFEGMDTPIPLSQCGSGYTHVLILLCVLYTKINSVVLFDEPQVFLHPSAEKAIYDLVNESREHQYIFTTHSPILINYPSEKYLVHVNKSIGVSTFTQLEHIQEVLSDIGISNSDYALSDKVIFVEGATEECVLPILLSHFGLKQIGYNYRILNMKGTGNYFTKKTAMREQKSKLDLVLSGVSRSPIPYKIIIDADNKPDEKLLELRESYGENIIILELREYENYFLDCYEELSEVINQEISEATDPEQIKAKIELLLADITDIKLFPRGASNITKDVVGSEILERLFKKYSLNYNKIVHGMELTKLVLNNTPEKLEFFKNELQDFIKG
ncbi:putative ATP-dependent endonuclease of OLD family [Paenibacillus sp. 4624]|uniref:ATP-dependent nuclease n=1 Tax=Paenibacillus sp. 4624 TaxID=3156453 RepID=UPI003D1A83F3